MNSDAAIENEYFSPRYATYSRQKCFIAYSQKAYWSCELLQACEEILGEPEFNLEPDYAGKHFDPNITLLQKALELIANARYGIYDLSEWKDRKSEWQLPRNVLIELGMAVALNRPTLLLRHTSSKDRELPEILKSVQGYVLEFGGYETLKKVLRKRLKVWVNTRPEQDWWNKYCAFGGKKCEYRETHPRAKHWGQQSLYGHVADEQAGAIDRDEFRSLVADVLDRYSDLKYIYLDEAPAIASYEFLLCRVCQLVRSTSFAIYRITRRTSAEAFIAIGISIGLEKLFNYRIPKILLVDEMRDVPSLLSGYECVEAQSSKERKEQLRRFLPSVIKQVRETVWKPRPLPYVEVRIPVYKKFERLDEDSTVQESITDNPADEVNKLSDAAKEAESLKYEVINFLTPEWLTWKEIKKLINELASNNPFIREVALSTSLNKLKFTQHILNCLTGMNILTLGDLVQRTEADLKTNKDLGRKSLKTIKRTLNELGVSLNMLSPSMYVASPARASGTGNKIRIYELAKVLKLDNKTVILDARSEGIDVNAPSNTVPIEVAERIRSKYFPKKAAPKTVPKIIEPVKQNIPVLLVKDATTASQSQSTTRILKLKPKTKE
ncbi:MAG TPA: DNA-directed RNA polymerase subunit alpha C-terminal domain-containing protein [Blastocatellia bacterium]|nr:DNA-directed RNA polymerase subunit alpha C-terminal domain-containing protein [Blastocatellia bacterium]